MIKSKITMMVSVFFVCFSSHSMMRQPWNPLRKNMSTNFNLCRYFSDSNDKFPIFFHGEYHQKLRNELGQEGYTEYIKAMLEVSEMVQAGMQARLNQNNINDDLKKELSDIINSGPFKEISSMDIGQRLRQLLEAISKEDTQ